MASRKAAFESSGDEPPSKRPRLEDDTDAASTPSLDYINSDCLLHILTFLPSEDLNSIAICSHRYQKARGHESLDQTRTGTIVISQQHTIASLFNLIATNGWVESFQGNRTHLKIIGLERLDGGGAWRATDCRLSGVTTLELAGSFSETRFYYLWPLGYAFENLLEVDMSSLTGASEISLLCNAFSARNSNLGRFVWSGCQGGDPLKLSGCSFSRSRNLTDIVMDDSHFALDGRWGSDESAYMFQRCESLQRLSIKNAAYGRNVYGEEALDLRPVSQDMLIDMVRRHPTMRWLRSDLSAENVAMLQQERPDITFVQ